MYNWMPSFYRGLPKQQLPFEKIVPDEILFVDQISGTSVGTVNRKVIHCGPNPLYKLHRLSHSLANRHYFNIQIGFYGMFL